MSKNGKVNLIKVTSRLAGNCRLGVYDEIKTSGATPLKKAKGQNPNALFAIAEIKQPLHSEKAKLNNTQLKKIYEYDLSTQVGKTYVFKTL